MDEVVVEVLVSVVVVDIIAEGVVEVAKVDVGVLVVVDFIPCSLAFKIMLASWASTSKARFCTRFSSTRCIYPVYSLGTKSL